jgi:hypothetical protein
MRPEDSAAAEPSQVDEAEAAELLSQIDRREIVGRGRFWTAAWCRTLSIHRHETLEAAQRAMALLDRVGCGGGCRGNHELIEAPETFSGRKHVGCDWRCMDPMVPGARRQKMWASRYDPRKRAAWFAELYDEAPDVGRARAAIINRCQRCADCAREAGAQHIAKLKRAVENNRLPSNYAEMVLG